MTLMVMLPFPVNRAISHSDVTDNDILNEQTVLRLQICLCSYQSLVHCLIKYGKQLQLMMGFKNSDKMVIINMCCILLKYNISYQNILALM